MAITHVPALRNTLANSFTAAVDAGTGAGRLLIYPATIAATHTATSALANLPFNDPSFGAAAGGQSAMGTTVAVQDTNATGGAANAANFVITDSAYAEVIRGTVSLTGGGGDIILSRLNIAAGDTVTITAMTYAASL